MHIDIELELERECWCCYGHGTSFDDDGEEVPCEPCEGLGYIATDQGNSMLNFLRRHKAQLL